MQSISDTVLQNCKSHCNCMLMISYIYSTDFCSHFFGTISLIQTEWMNEWCWFANNAWQAYIGTAPTPRDIFCVKYVSSARELTIIIITLVLCSCLVVVVAVMVFYYRHRRRHRVALAAGSTVGDGVGAGRGTNKTESKIGGNVRLAFGPLHFYDDNDPVNVRWVFFVSNSNSRVGTYIRAEPQPLTSLLWRHRATWRHQWRHQSILPGHFPIGSQ